MAGTVLLVEDDPMVRSILKDMLEDLGCAVVTASCGKEALALLATNKDISLLVTDVNMPEMDGIELGKRAAAMRRDLKTLLISGRGDQTNGFPLLRKPFDTNSLKKRLQETVGRC